MQILNAKAKITLGLVGLMISLLLMCFFLKIIPNKYAADTERRAALAETIAVYSTALVKNARVQRLLDDFNLLIDRNEDLLSLALRDTNGNLLVATGDHDQSWQGMTGEFSTTTQVKVPIWSGQEKWGQLEIRFEPLVAPGVWGFFNRPIVQTILFLGLGCFLIYYFYLGHVLRQLDPSQAVPGRVRSALDTMAEGLLILDRKEQIVLANQAFSGMVNKPAEELVGFKAGELPWINKEGTAINKADRPWVVSLLEGSVLKDRTVRLQLTEDEYRTFKTNCSPVLGEKGKYAGVLISFDDITELEQKELELINSKREAEEANKAKSSFLANMSHEIRTPMNAILGFTEILKRGYVKNEQESLKYLNTIHSSGKNLLELINDILDLSKVESGKLVVERLKVQPYAIIDEVVQMLKVKADEKGIGLSFMVTEELPEEIETDPVRLRQIIFNLIGNAVKFTEQGTVTVNCRLDNEAPEPLLIIDVKDTGIGMSEEEQGDIFDPFTQADNSVSRRFGGTGLGLAISQRFAQALGGDIRVVSEMGKGSTFSVALATGPLDGVACLSAEQISQLNQQEATAATVNWDFPSAKVLVVDDGAENRELIRLLLEEAGLEVVEAENGLEAFGLTSQENYDVILMDLNMPVMNGYQAAEKMRAEGVTVPIVALTAYAMKGDQEKCFAAGYSDYLSKPLNIDQFMELMARLLGGKRKPLDSLAKSEVSAAATAENQIIGAPIYSRLSTDNKKLRAIIQRFIERLDTLLTEMDEGIEKKDYSSLASLAHTLKGSGGTVGFDVFTEPAKVLEEYAKRSNFAGCEDTVGIIKSLAARIVIGDQPTPVIDNKEPAQSAKGHDDMASKLSFDSQFLHEPITSRLASNQRMHRIIGNFIDGLEEKLTLMDSAVQNQNSSELASLAHWLKGAGGTVGFDVFTRPAETMENFAKLNHLKQAAKLLEDIKQISQRLVRPGAKEDVSRQMGGLNI